MFGWLFGKGDGKKFQSETKKSFSAVKDDMTTIGKWIKHLDSKDKQLFDVMEDIKAEISTIRGEIEGLREGIGLINETEKNKQVFKKMPVLNKQTAVEGVENSVQTAVQTGNIYDIFKILTANERLLIMTMLNNEMKLSYEDLALLLGKERATIRGQINTIKQKSEGLIEEFIEKNGKKRVFIPLEIREKLSKYAKVRVKKKKLNELNEEKEVENG
ncbi:MAG: hypothetical protein Q8L29_01710 [archaeon]|nr:hypothetical protein [archaeon]